jgi:8-oxo-dGTP pyrophosphatase MutT (NUDIX family)/predicted transcriptional regulator
MSQNSLQLEILTKLLTSKPGFRFSEMKPQDVESDLYNYHLQHLVKNGLIEKTEDKYILTQKGKHYIWDTNPIDPFGQIDDKFKIAVSMFLIRENNGVKEVLFQTRTRLPFSGSKENPSRGIKKGELILEAAKRGFKEETGLDVDFSFIGVVRHIRYQGGRGEVTSTLLNDMIYHICTADKYSGELIEKNDFGENYWLSIDETIECIKKKKHISDYEAVILEQLKTKRSSEIPFFYYEDKMTVEDY